MKTDLVIAAYIFHENKVLLIHHKKSGLWLPVGGHIEKDETPDETVLREAKEEVNLDIEIISTDDTRPAGAVTKVLAPPFCVNVHDVGDHYHCCFFYVCKAKNPEQIKIQPGEILGYTWLSKDQLNQAHIPRDVRLTALKAFNLLQSY